VTSLGNLEVTRLLLGRGAKADAENIHGQTPLHLVSQREPYDYENAKVARLLLRRGMDVNARDKHQSTPLHFASRRGHYITIMDAAWMNNESG
jgi:ankyrin repeat protein